MARAGASTTFRIGELEIVCSSLDRVVFPDDGLTKGDVLGYYADVAELLVPELRGRPLTIERYTKGLAGGGFFQKHWQKHYPPWIDHVELQGKTTVTYPIADTAAALVYFANQGAIALHVTTSRKDALLHPDLLVFDLDPPEGGFELVRRAARILHELLDGLGLPAFVKTTGSKGLHVVTPLDGHDGYDGVHAFCARVSARLCREHEALFTTEFYKKDRHGKLFLDTMRNGYGATVVAPWSLRGRRGAPVSAPIEWSELDDPALAADGFRLRDVRARLDARGDPWARLRERPGSLVAASARLSG